MADVNLLTMAQIETDGTSGVIYQISPYAFSDPTEAKVANGVGYYFDNTSKVGTKPVGGGGGISLTIN